MLRSRPATASIDRDRRGDDEPLPRRWTVFTVIAIALLMASIDQTSVATALPAIQKDLGGSLAWSSWTITVYSLGQIMSMPIAGKLSDQFGRKTISSYDRPSIDAVEQSTLNTGGGEAKKAA